MDEMRWMEAEENSAIVGSVPERLRDILERYMELGHHPGSTLKALLAGDLFGFFSGASEDAVAALPAMVHMLGEFPAKCVGSHEKVEHWINTRGERLGDF